MGAVGMIRRFPGEPAPDPVGNPGKDLHAADPQLDYGRLLSGHEERDPRLVALVAGRRPVPFPGDRGAAAALPDGPVGHHRHVLAAAVAAPEDLGDVPVDVAPDQRREGKRTIVDSRQVLDLVDRAGIDGERLDDAGMAAAVGVGADTRDVLAAPPGSAAVAGPVLVAAHPFRMGPAVALGAGRTGLRVLLVEGLGRLLGAAPR